MEQRIAVRRPIAIDVVLSYGGLGLVSCRTRNISLGGMFVEAGRISLPMFARVKASVLLEAAGIDDSFQAEARILHVREHGMGLQFDQLSPAFHQALHQLLQGKSGLWNGGARHCLIH
ncbi:MAG: PilZ domain-containing protein [Gammaproteobacteria bacterium]|nr:PilZ domain-containing protein [Gammaproteobacteria bacterium]